MILSSMADLLRLNKSGYKTFSMVPSNQERMVAVSCPICYNQRVKAHWDCENFLFSSCSKCGHIYQNPMPQPSDLLQRYDEEYKEYEVENGEKFFTLMLYGLRDAGLSRIEAQVGSWARVLDIGCATGVLVRYLADRGWNAQGLEVCEPAARYGIERRGVDIHIGTLEDAQLPGEHYDFVHFSHVIEHLPDINLFLSQVRRITKIGGYLSITTPNRDSFQAWLMKERWRSAIADHTHLFNRRELKALITRHGFEQLRSKTWGGIPVGMATAPVKQMADRIARITGFGDVTMVLCRRLA